jgi:hypothetical protein
MGQTSRGVDDWTDTTYDKIKTLTNQKTLEDNLLDSKPPETPAVTLEPHLAAKAYNDMLILLGKMRGIAGHPLSYVLRPNLKGPNDADPDDETEDPPPVGQPGSPYVLIEDKLCRRAPILRTDLTHFQLSASLETLESDGPFEEIELVESREEVQQDQERATCVSDPAHYSPWWATCCVNRECHYDQAAVLQV